MFYVKYTRGSAANIQAFKCSNFSHAVKQLIAVPV